MDAEERAKQLAARRKVTQAREQRNTRLWTAACGPEWLFRCDLRDVVVTVEASELLGCGQESVSLAPVLRVGKALASHLAQIFLQSPPVLRWRRAHAGVPCAASPGACVACFLGRGRGSGVFAD